MSEAPLKQLDESIALELNLAKLYTLFHDSLSEDEDFWWQLAMEERGHAALLQQEKKQPQPTEFFPEGLIDLNLDELVNANQQVTKLIGQFSVVPPSRSEAFKAALHMEEAAGEYHYQQFLDNPSNSYSANIFKQLNQEDRDHAERIKLYIKHNHIV